MALRKASLNIASRAAQLPTFRSAHASRSAAVRCYASEAPQDSSDRYVSPYKIFFDSIKDGKTFMGSQEFTEPEVKHLSCGIPEFALRFKTTTYGRLLDAPFVRPNEHRVTLTVATHYLPLNEVEMMVLKEIVGTRLNEDKGVLQLSSVQFGSRIENKRHVVSQLERLVNSALQLAKELPEGKIKGKAMES
jgi:hypothetical protein